jgi:WD40 repeat protein
MAEDLRRFLADRPIQARRSAAWEHAWRWCRRNPAVASLLGVIAAMIFVVIAGMIVKNAELSRALTDSTSANEAAQVRLWESLLARARAVRMSGQPGQRLKCLETIDELLAMPLPAKHSRNDLRTEAVAALALPDLELVREWEGLPLGTWAWTVDPTVTCYARVDREGVVSVRSMADDRKLLSWTEKGFAPFTGAEGLLHLSPGGRYLAFGNRQIGVLRVRRLDDNKAVLCHESSLFSVIVDGGALTFSSDGKRLLYSSRDKDGRNMDWVVLNLDTGATRKLPLSSPMGSVQFSPDCKRFAGIGSIQDKTAFFIFDIESGKETGRIILPEYSDHYCWHPNGHWLAIWGRSDVVRLLDCTTSKLLRTFDGPFGNGCYLAFSPSGDLLFTNSWSGILRAWEVSSGRQVLSQAASGYHVLACGSGGAIPAISVTDGRRLQVFRFHETQTVRTFKRVKGAPGGDFHDQGAQQLFSCDGRLLLSTTLDHGAASGIAILDLDQRTELAHIDLPHHQMLAWDKDGSLLNYGLAGLLRWPLQSAVGEVRHYRLGPPQRMLRFPTGGVTVGVDDARQIFALPNGDRGAVRWSPDQPERFVALQPQQDVRTCAVSPDGRWIATGSHGYVSDDGCGVKVWNGETGMLVKEFHVPGARVLFSPDGRWLYTNSIGGKLWHTETWEEAHTVGGAWACFAPKGRLLAVEAGARTVRLVVPDDGRELVRLEGPDHNSVSPRCFSPDGAKLVTFGSDLSTLHVWDLRALRAELSALGLDWEAPPYPPAPPSLDSQSLQVTVDLGFVEVERLLSEGNRHWSAREYGEAIEAVRRAVERDPNSPEANNNLAWFLIAGPNELRNTKEAVLYARKAVALDPQSQVPQNTLGVALYRDGRPAEAIPTLELSLKLGGGQLDAFDLYFLAMAHWQLGQKEEARKRFKQADEWVKKNKETLAKVPGGTEEVRGFRAEAVELLKIDKPVGPEPKDRAPPK